MIRIAASAAIVTAGLGSAGAAAAATLIFECEEQDTKAPAEMIAYEGDASVTLKLKASFGEIKLPATMETRVREIDGMELKATGIRAAGPATVTMPDRAAIEACIASKTKPDQTGDEDIFSLLLESCRPGAGLGKAPIQITASVEIAMMQAESAGQPPDVEVYVKRTYLEKTAVPDGTFAIESFPPPKCALADGR